jgi:hypothetical protein
MADTASLQTKLETLKTNNAADATAIADLETEVNTPVPATTADNVHSAVVDALKGAGLVSVFGSDELKSALEADGFTVTAPAAPADTTAAPTDANATDPNAGANQTGNQAGQLSGDSSTPVGQATPGSVVSPTDGADPAGENDGDADDLTAAV